MIPSDAGAIPSETEPFEALPLDQLRRRTSVKWQALGPDVLPLWVAEMDVLLAPAVSERLIEAVSCGDTGYPIGEDYQRAFAEFAARHWGWQPEVTDMRLVLDVLTGMRETLLQVTGPGSPVIVPAPVYPPFLELAGDAGRELVTVRLASDHRLDLDALRQACRAAHGRRGALLLCNPHNPTGTVHTAAELREVAAMAAEFGVFVIADEIHAPLVPAPGGFQPYLAVAPAAAAVAVTSASKSYNLAGLKAALVIANPVSRHVLEGYPEHVKYSASHLGVLSHSVALRAGDEWLAAVNAAIARNRAFVTQLLAEQVPAARVVRAEATYLMWVDARALPLGEDPAQVLRKEGKVGFSAGLPFGPGGEGHFRINLAASRAVLSEAVSRTASVVASKL